jgi:hypothetical protein
MAINTCFGLLEAVHAHHSPADSAADGDGGLVQQWAIRRGKSSRALCNHWVDRIAGIASIVMAAKNQ